MGRSRADTGPGTGALPEAGAGVYHGQSSDLKHVPPDWGEVAARDPRALVAPADSLRLPPRQPVPAGPFNRLRRQTNCASGEEIRRITNESRQFAAIGRSPWRAGDSARRQWQTGGGG